MEALFKFVWVALLLAGFLLLRQKRTTLLGLGFFCLGGNNLVHALWAWDLIRNRTMDKLEPILQVSYLAGLALLVFGAILVASRSIGASVGAASPGDTSDASPTMLFTPRNDTNTYSRAVTMRDHLCALFERKAKEAGFQFLAQRSQAYGARVWCRLDYTLPSEGQDVTLPASVNIEVERFDFHCFEHTLTVTVQVGTRIKTIPGVIGIEEEEVDIIHRHIVSPGQRLRLSNRVREAPWQLWRPANRVVRIGTDWTAILLTIVGMAALVIPYAGPVITVGVFIGLGIRSHRRRTHVLTTGKPQSDPRFLRLTDSWGASIGGLGPLSQAVKMDLLNRLKSAALEGMTVETESIGYLSVDQWVEREQICVRHHRSVGYVHVVPYGESLYVAWECHLNPGTWVEQRLASGVDRMTGLDVVANRVVAGFHRLSEYDVTDSSFLSEWLHEAVRKELKLKMAGQKIDQELDFTIRRESRQGVLAPGAREAESKETTFKSALKRLS
jgi:hypothetical protein